MPHTYWTAHETAGHGLVASVLIYLAKRCFRCLRHPLRNAQERKEIKNKYEDFSLPKKQNRKHKAKSNNLEAMVLMNYFPSEFSNYHICNLFQRCHFCFSYANGGITMSRI